MVRVRSEKGDVKEFEALCRLDTPVEVNYYKNGGILPAVLRSLVHG